MGLSKNSRKLLTLNIHSWIEKDGMKKLEYLADAIVKENFTIIALQEVNQRSGASVIDHHDPMLHEFFMPHERTVIKSDNYALLLVNKLKERGLIYNWFWSPSHIGYDRYDEGLSFLSLLPIVEVRTGYVSATKRFENYRARKVAGIRTDDDTWYYSVHLGRWEDGAERFDNQWENLMRMLKEDMGKSIYLMGDFNSSAQEKDRGYSMVAANGLWHDCYALAQEKDDGNTVHGKIDGWNDEMVTAIRIDYIFKNNKKPVKYSRVIFDGRYYPIVSDHYGVVVCEEG